MPAARSSADSASNRACCPNRFFQSHDAPPASNSTTTVMRITFPFPSRGGGGGGGTYTGRSGGSGGGTEGDGGRWGGGGVSMPVISPRFSRPHKTGIHDSPDNALFF